MFIVLSLFLSLASFASLPMMQGLTTDHSTQINFIIDKTVEPKISLIDPKTNKSIVPSKIKSTEREFSKEKVVQLYFNHLLPNHKYILKITDQNKKWLDSRNLKTYPKNLKHPQIALASCMNDTFSTIQEAQWKDFVSFKPDLILLFGDTVYIDHKKEGGWVKKVDPKLIWNRYVENRHNLQLYKINPLIPILATWDDHDYGKNDGGAEYEYKNQSKEIFKSFFSQEPEENFLEDGPGIATLTHFFGLNIFLMDDRYFQTKESQWGNEQTSWLFKNLNSNLTPALIINGIQFFGAYAPFESFERNNPEDFKNFREQISKTKTPFMLISGDRHLAELMQLTVGDVGQSTYEFTTSAIHAKVFPGVWLATPNPRKLKGESGVYNYGILKIKRLKPFTTEVSAYGPHKRLLFKKNLIMKGKL